MTWVPISERKTRIGNKTCLDLWSDWWLISITPAEMTPTTIWNSNTRQMSRLSSRISMTLCMIKQLFTLQARRRAIWTFMLYKRSLRILIPSGWPNSAHVATTWPLEVKMPASRCGKCANNLIPTILSTRTKLKTIRQDSSNKMWPVGLTASRSIWVCSRASRSTSSASTPTTLSISAGMTQVRTTRRRTIYSRAVWTASFCFGRSSPRQVRR